MLIRRTTIVARNDCMVFAETEEESAELIVKRAVAVPGDPVPRSGYSEIWTRSSCLPDNW